MAKKTLETNLLAAHINALEKTLAAVEVQIAAVKTVLKLTQGDASGAVDDEEFEEEEVKPKKTAKKKAVEEEEDENAEDEENDDEEASDEDAESDDEEAEEEKPAPKKGKVSKKQLVIQALQAYSTKHSRAKALKVLGKFGVKSVHDLEPEHYADILEILE